MNAATARTAARKPNRTARAQSAPAAPSKKPNWAAMLHHALTQPGTLTAAYRLFHNYSAGNVTLLAEESMFRGEPLAPVASYAGWQKLGYQVKKGERAWGMVMPVTIHTRRDDEEKDGEAGKSEPGSDKKTIFILRNHWFTLNQVEAGPEAQPLQEPKNPEWSLDRACAALGIAQIPFDLPRGNTQGYASAEGIALNPLARFPIKTAAHELAHVLLGHIGDAGIVDHEEKSGALKEVEAESTAYIVGAMLGLEDEALSSARAYVQGWLSRSDSDAQEFEEKSAARIFKVANQILKAGAAGEAGEAGETGETGETEQPEQPEE